MAYELIFCFNCNSNKSKYGSTFENNEYLCLDCQIGIHEELIWDCEKHGDFAEAEKFHNNKQKLIEKRNNQVDNLFEAELIKDEHERIEKQRYEKYINSPGSFENFSLKIHSYGTYGILPQRFYFEWELDKTLWEHLLGDNLDKNKLKRQLLQDLIRECERRLNLNNDSVLKEQ